jgi:hypothetical protein
MATLTITKPASGAVFYAGDKIALDITVTNASWTKVSILNPSGTQVYIYEQKFTSYKADWKSDDTAALTAAGTYKLRVTTTDATTGVNTTHPDRTFTINAMSGSIDNVAFHNFHKKHPYHTSQVEHGAVISKYGTIHSMGPIQNGVKYNAITPLLNGIGVSTSHYTNLCGVVADNRNNTSSTVFGSAVRGYLDGLTVNAVEVEADGLGNQARQKTVNNGNNGKALSYTTPAGLVHCHWTGNTFSTQDNNLASCFGMTVYVQRSSSVFEKTTGGSATNIAVNY